MLDQHQPASYKVFKYNGIDIRIHRHTDNNSYWVVCSDLCKAVGLSNPSYVAKKFSDKDVRLHCIRLNNRNQIVTWISQSAVLALDSNFKLDAGHSFISWFKKIITGSDDVVIVSRKLLKTINKILDNLLSF
jgi:prophage antirepressor-like protein